MSKHSIITATYPMFGDVNPDEWIRTKLDEAEKGGLIGSYEVLQIKPGSYGIQNIDFAIDVKLADPDENTLLSRRGNDVRMMVEAKKITDKIVGDTDTRVLSIQVI